MKKYFLVFVCLLLIEYGLVIADSILDYSFLNTVTRIISMPISYIDRSYPFYAGGPYFGLFLSIVNISIHTFVLFFIHSKSIQKK